MYVYVLVREDTDIDVTTIEGVYLNYEDAERLAKQRACTGVDYHIEKMLLRTHAA